MQSTVHINHLDQNTNTSGGIYVIYVMITELFTSTAITEVAPAPALALLLILAPAQLSAKLESVLERQEFSLVSMYILFIPSYYYFYKNVSDSVCVCVCAFVRLKVKTYWSDIFSLFIIYIVIDSPRSE